MFIICRKIIKVKKKRMGEDRLVRKGYKSEVEDHTLRGRPRVKWTNKVD